jgi:hypothetical protein
MDRLDYYSEPDHYKKLIASIVIILVGIYLRFADFRYSSLIATVIFLIGTVWMFSIVFSILEKPAKKS